MRTRIKKYSETSMVVYLSHAQKFQLFRIADQDRKTMSTFVRELIEEHYGEPTAVDEANARRIHGAA